MLRLQGFRKALRSRQARQSKCCTKRADVNNKQKEGSIVDIYPSDSVIYTDTSSAPNLPTKKELMEALRYCTSLRIGKCYGCPFWVPDDADDADKCAANLLVQVAMKIPPDNKEAT
jgi:hypothetical protein